MQLALVVAGGLSGRGQAGRQQEANMVTDKRIVALLAALAAR